MKRWNWRYFCLCTKKDQNDRKVKIKWKINNTIFLNSPKKQSMLTKIQELNQQNSVMIYFMSEHYFLINTSFAFTKIKLLKLFGLLISSIFFKWLFLDMRGNDFWQPCDIFSQNGLWWCIRSLHWWRSFSSSRKIRHVFELHHAQHIQGI